MLWLLQSPNGLINYLWEKDTYSVGRKNTDIIVASDDSISRNHAQILIKNNHAYVVDTGSKYGTYLGDVRLEKNVEMEVQDGTKIKFGLLQSVYEFTEIKIVVSTSNISTGEKTKLCKNIELIKGQYVADWTEECTHLTVSVIKLTVKVLCALTHGKPIVNTTFWEKYLDCLKNNSPAPDPKLYLPEINESLLNKRVTLEYNPDREILFADKVFVFLSEKAMKNMKDVINIAGGKVILWEKSKISFEKLIGSSPKYLLIEENTQQMAKYVPNFTSFYEAVKHLATNNKRSIPLQEIALAVLYCSCEKDCNPDFNRVATLIAENTQNTDSSQIIVFDTQANSQRLQNITSQQSEEISDSLQSEQTVKPTSSQNVPLPSNSVTDIPEFVKPTTVVHDSVPSNDGSFELQINITESEEKQNVPVPAPQLTSTHFSGIKRVADECSDSACKRVKEDKVNTNPFSFRSSKTSTQVTVKVASQNESGPSTEKCMSNDNPFAKKRKADSQLEHSSKKTPLANISNLETRNSNQVYEKSREFFSSTGNNEDGSNFCPNISEICPTKWLSKLTLGLKKENITTDENIVVKMEDINEINEDVIKWKESFRDKIIIEIINIDITNNSALKSMSKTTNDGVNNFKKFGKIQPLYIQTHITAGSNCEEIICGRESKAILVYSDDEEDNEDDFTCVPTNTKRRLNSVSHSRFNF